MDAARFRRTVNEPHDPRIDFAEWLHASSSAFAGETEAWAHERVARAQHRLNEHRPDSPALETTILWIAPPLAFTLAGRYVYISRSLFQRLPFSER